MVQLITNGSCTSRNEVVLGGDEWRVVVSGMEVVVAAVVARAVVAGLVGITVMAGGNRWCWQGWW